MDSKTSQDNEVKIKIIKMMHWTEKKLKIGKEIGTLMKTEKRKKILKKGNHRKIFMNGKENTK